MQPARKLSMATQKKRGSKRQTKRPKQAEEAEVEDKESSTTSSAVKLFEQLGISSGQLSKEDLSRIIAHCQEQLSPGT